MSLDRRHFFLPPAYQGKKIFLEFEGAMKIATVYCNGDSRVKSNPIDAKAFIAQTVPADAASLRVPSGHAALAHALPVLLRSGSAFTIRAFDGNADYVLAVSRVNGAKILSRKIAA